MNNFRPKILLSLLVMFFFSLTSGFASDLGVNGVQVFGQNSLPGEPILTGTNTVQIEFTNTGGDAITEFDIDMVYTWTNQVGGPITENYHVDGINLNPGQTHTYDLTFDFDLYEIYTVTATVSAVNGITPDDDPLNDAGMTSIAPAFNENRNLITVGTGGDFATVAAFATYFNAAGMVSDLTVNILPGTYTNRCSFDGSNSGDNTMTINGNLEAAVVISTFNAAENYAWQFTNMNVVIDGIEFELGFGAAAGGRILDFIGGTNITINDCFLWGADFEAAPYEDFASIYTDGTFTTFTMTDNLFFEGAYGLYVANSGNPFDGTITLQDNAFIWFNVCGVSINLEPSLMQRNGHAVNIIENFFDSDEMIDDAMSGGLYVENGTFVDGNVFILEGTGSTNYFTAIKVVHDDGYEVPAIITNNIIGDYEDPAFYCFDISGIFLDADLGVISDNMILIDGTAANRSGIYVENSGDGDAHILIKENIFNLTNTNGIVSFSSFLKIYNNYMMADGPSTYNMIWLDDMSGVLANNMLLGNNIGGIFTFDAEDFHAYYNTVFIDNDNAAFPAIDVMFGDNKFKRNSFVNVGTGKAMNVDVLSLAGYSEFEENNYWTNGALLGSYWTVGSGDYEDIDDITDWQTTTGMGAGATNYPMVWDDEMLFVNFEQLDLGMYFEIDDPIFSAQDPLFEEIEKYDFDGTLRNGYYIGADNLEPQVSVATQPQDLIVCLDAPTNMLTVVADVSLGAEPLYQWVKDGEDLVGTATWKTNEALLFLDDIKHAAAGTYQCRIWSTGGGTPILTQPVLVYVLRDTKITDEPLDAVGEEGGVVMFEVRAHTIGVPNLATNPTFQPIYQWQDDAGNDLENDVEFEGAKIAGAQSSLLTISNISASDIGRKFKVVVTGYCGDAVESEVVTILPAPSVNITGQPTDQEPCEGEDITFKVTASMQNGGDMLTYQWYKDAVEMNDGTRITGTTTNTLSITAVEAADLGEYYCEVTVVWADGSSMTESDHASITALKQGPAITTQPEANVTVTEGDPFFVFVEATGDDIEYQWFLDGNEITGETSATFSKASATVTDDGSVYTCRVSNDCGEEFSNESTITVNLLNIASVIDGAAYGLTLENSPNPLNDFTTVKFYTPEAGKAEIVVTDMYGRQVAVIFDNRVTAGLHEAEFIPSNFGLASGVYNYTLMFNEYSISQRMVIVK